MVVLPGSTFPKRLWCAMEIFCYVQMGGSQDNLHVTPLDDNGDTFEQLVRFDVAKAECYLPRDRQQMLAVIETSFGTLAPFNTAVRRLYTNILRSSGAGETSSVIELARA